MHEILAIGLGTMVFRDSISYNGRFTFERIHNRKEQIFFTKERRIVRQKSGCLKHSNGRIFQVYPQTHGRIKVSWKWGPYV